MKNFQILFVLSLSISNELQSTRLKKAIPPLEMQTNRSSALKPLNRKFKDRPEPISPKTPSSEPQSPTSFNSFYSEEPTTPMSGAPKKRSPLNNRLKSQFYEESPDLPDESNSPASKMRMREFVQNEMRAMRPPQPQKPRGTPELWLGYDPKPRTRSMDLPQEEQGDSLDEFMKNNNVGRQTMENRKAFKEQALVVEDVE